MDKWDRNEIQEDIDRIDQIMALNIFIPDNAGNPLLRSAFIEILIALRDPMYKSEKYAERISFTDDVTLTNQVTDVSALILYVRNALCHLDSDNHYLEQDNIKASFNVCFVKGTLLKIGDFEQTNPYQDDICFFFGSQRIFLRRPILRAYGEAKNKLIPLLNITANK